MVPLAFFFCWCPLNEIDSVITYQGWKELCALDEISASVALIGSQLLRPSIDSILSKPTIIESQPQKSLWGCLVHFAEKRTKGLWGLTQPRSLSQLWLRLCWSPRVLKSVWGFCFCHCCMQRLCTRLMVPVISSLMSLWAFLKIWSDKCQLAYTLIYFLMPFQRLRKQAVLILNTLA